MNVRQVSWFSPDTDSSLEPEDHDQDLAKSDSADPGEQHRFTAAGKDVAEQSTSACDPCAGSYSWDSQSFTPETALVDKAQLSGASAPFDINKVYAGIVDGLRVLLQRLEAQGEMTADLQTEFDAQTDAVVSISDALPYHVSLHNSSQGVTAGKHTVHGIVELLVWSVNRSLVVILTRMTR